MITANERLKTVLDGQKADRPPCICPGGMMNMVTVGLQDEISVFFPDAHYDAQKMAALAKAVYDRGFFENYGVPFCMTVEAEAMGAEVTMGRKDIEPHVTDYAFDDVRNYKQVKPIDLESGRAKVVLDAIKILKSYGDDVPIVGNLVGPVSVASSVMDAVKYYKQLRKQKELSHEYMDWITGELIRFGVAQVEAGADVIAIADPSGTGEIMGPGPFQEYAVPYIERLQRACQDAGAQTIVHICGQMHSVYNQIAQISSNALSFDAIVPLKEARENLPGRVIMGNVSTFAIERSSADKVRTLTRACMRNGTDIVAPACGLGMGSSSENVRAVLEAVKGA